MWQASSGMVLALAEVSDHTEATDFLMPRIVSEERSVYLTWRYREVRCRLWYEVTPLKEGVLRYFLIRVEELE
jgi:hypothetical protein